MEYSKLKEAAQRSNISIKKLCVDMGMSFAGIKRGWENETIEFRKVREISEYFGVSISSWDSADETKPRKNVYATQAELLNLQTELTKLKSSLGNLLK